MKVRRAGMMDNECWYSAQHDTDDRGLFLFLTYKIATGQ